MADNVVSNPGSGGATWATDEIAGAHYPRIKLIFGINNQNAGDVAVTNPLPVAQQGDVGVTQSGAWTVAATQSGAWMVSITGTVTVANAGTFPVQATQSGVWSVEAVQSGAWAVTANAGTNLNTSALALESGGNLATLAAIVDTDKARVSIVDPLPSGANALGKVDVTSVVPGTTSLSLGKAEDEPAGSGDTGVMMLAVRRDIDGVNVDADGDYAELQVDQTGRLKVSTESALAVVQYALVEATASGDNTIATPAAGKGITVINYTIVSAGDVTARWKGGAATNASGPMTLKEGTGAAPDSGQWGLFKLPQDQPLVLNLSAAVTVGGHVTYAET